MFQVPNRHVYMGKNNRTRKWETSTGLDFRNCLLFKNYGLFNFWFVRQTQFFSLHFHLLKTSLISTIPPKMSSTRILLSDLYSTFLFFLYLSSHKNTQWQKSDYVNFNRFFSDLFLKILTSACEKLLKRDFQKDLPK